MKYIDLLNAFWKSVRDKPCNVYETALYLYLLHECSRRMWKNPFELSTRDIETALGMSRKTISAARDGLKARGFISFSKAAGSGKSGYLIVGADKTNSDLHFNNCVSEGNTKLNDFSNCVSVGNTNTPDFNNCVSEGNTKPKKKRVAKNICVSVGNTNENHTLISNKDIYTNRECASHTRAHAQEQPSIFAEEEKKKKPSPQRAPSTPPPPTLDEVLAHFKSQHAETRLENWEESARRFFDYFNAVDWRDKYNRRIIRWDSRANSWILDDEQRLKDKLKNETKRQQPASPTGGAAPSGGVPIRGKVTPACGLKRRDAGGKKGVP